MHSALLLHFGHFVVCGLLVKPYTYLPPSLILLIILLLPDFLSQKSFIQEQLTEHSLYVSTMPGPGRRGSHQERENSSSYKAEKSQVFPSLPSKPL